jgi:hypothetical protein
MQNHAAIVLVAWVVKYMIVLSAMKKSSSNQYLAGYLNNSNKSITCPVFSENN